jgi:hypothetical protein
MTIQDQIKYQGEGEIKGVGKLKVTQYKHPNFVGKKKAKQMFRINFKASKELKDLAREFIHRPTC